MHWYRDRKNGTVDFMTECVEVGRERCKEILTIHIDRQKSLRIMATKDGDRDIKLIQDNVTYCRIKWGIFSVSRYSLPRGPWMCLVHLMPQVSLSHQINHPKCPWYAWMRWTHFNNYPPDHGGQICLSIIAMVPVKVSLSTRWAWIDLIQGRFPPI